MSFHVKPCPTVEQSIVRNVFSYALQSCSCQGKIDFHSRTPRSTFHVINVISYALMFNQCYQSCRRTAMLRGAPTERHRGWLEKCPRLPVRSVADGVQRSYGGDD